MSLSLPTKARFGRRTVTVSPTRLRGRVTVFALLGLLLASSSTPAVSQSPNEPFELAAVLAPSSAIANDHEIDERSSTLSGRVSTERSPLDSVRVYAYELADLELRKVVTDRLGEFSFLELPAGLYKVIAHKPGFVPAVVLVTRTTADAYQFLDLQLAEDAAVDGETESDFWTIRSKIPTDVLRDIQFAEAQLLQESPPTPALSASMSAISGSRDLAFSAAELSGGGFDIQTRLGDLELELETDFRRLASQSASSLGRSTNLQFHLEHAQGASLSVHGRESLLRYGGTPDSLEQYGVEWRQPIGPGTSRFAARYASENNYYGDGRLQPLGFADETTSWTVEGDYETQLGQRNSLRSGLSFRQTEVGPGQQLQPGARAIDSLAAPHERMQLFGLGELQVQPSFVVEYGMFTTFDDGSVSFSPHAGVMVELGSAWRLEAAARERFANRAPEELRPFAPAMYGMARDCGVAEQHCYRTRVVRSLGSREGNEIEVGLVHREYAETVRVYFSDNFFDRLESLFLVPGDRLPEVQVGFTKQLGRDFLTRFESTVADGGGGWFRDASGRSYRNDVGYVITSIDTHYKPSATGVMLAFHRIEQSLDTLDGRSDTTGTDLDVDRLQILVTQSLQALFGLSSDWALSLDMQLSRGRLPFDGGSSADEIRRSVVGGVAVRF